VPFKLKAIYHLATAAQSAISNCLILYRRLLAIPIRITDWSRWLAFNKPERFLSRAAVRLLEHLFR